MLGDEGEWQSGIGQKFIGFLTIKMVEKKTHVSIIKMANLLRLGRILDGVLVERTVPRGLLEPTNFSVYIVRYMGVILIYSHGQL